MKLLLIDGYSLLYRAYFSSPPLTTKDGEPTGALFGFMKMVLRLLDEARPDFAMVALDAHAPTFRHDADATYKANRPETPDDMKAQSNRVRPMLEGFGIPYYEHVGFEADDIIGTLAANGPGEGCAVTIVTGDGDALQLARDDVRVMLTRKGVSDLVEYSPDGVKERFGFGPELLPDYKGLRGDTSDNIPGVPGIGEKTGMSLVSKFGSLENLYEHLEEVTPPRIRDLLVQHREIAFHSRHMARIVTDLPLDIDFQACRYRDARGDDKLRARALETAQALEFKSLMARFGAGLAGESVFASEEKHSEVENELTQAQNAEQARLWLEKHAESRPVAVLIEEGALVFGAEGQSLHFGGAPEALRDWLEDETRQKIAHDAKTLQLALAQSGVKMRGVAADTFLMAYLLDPAHPAHPVGALAAKYLKRTVPAPPEAPKAAKAKPKTAPPTSLFDDEPEIDEAAQNEATLLILERRRAHGAAACAVFQLAPVLRGELEKIEEATLFDQLEMPLVEVLVAMEQCGMLLDVAKLKEIGVQLKSDAERLQKEIWESAGEEFNVGSTKQLQVVLFEKLGLARGRSIKTGFSTDVHTLEKLAEDHEIVRKILDYRGVVKLQSTYVEALLEGRDPKTDRVHTNLNQTGTVSGRVSSSSPNLQNIPIRTAQGRLIRRAFIAPPGHVLMKADYSQIELRILAHITGDEPLIEAFRSGQDVHSRTASELFGIAVEDVDAEMRRKAKMTNYAIAYGVSGFGLAKQLGIDSPGEAQKFIKHYFETLPGIKKYIDDISATAKAQGYVATLLGRRRPLPEINSPRAVERAAAERTAINHPIQGTSADIMKIAMLAVFDEMRRLGVKSRMIMQVHDELVFEVPEDEVTTMAPLVRRLMSEVPTERLQLRVPLETDVGCGPNWEEAK